MRFALKLALLFLSVFLISSAVIVYFVYDSGIKAFHHEIQDKLENHAFHTMGMIDRMFFERMVDIRVIAGDSIIRSGNSSPRQITERLIEYRNTLKSYESISFFDFNRIRIADTSGLNIGSRHRMTPYWKEISEGKDTAMDIYRSESIGKALFHFISVVKDERGLPRGVVVSRMPVEKLYDIVKYATGAHMEEDVLIEMTDKEGLVLYSNHDIKSILKARSSHWDHIKDFLGSENKIATFYDYHPEIGRELNVYAREQGFQDYKGNDWVLQLRIPAKKAFASVMELRDRLAVILSFFAALITLAIIYFSRIITKPIRQISDASAEIGKGNLDVRIMSTAKDEVGQLAKSFNAMAADLKESHTKLTNYSAGLEKMVKERTRELSKAKEQVEKELEERRHAEEKLAYTTFYDSLTGLPNRALFLDRLGRAMARLKREKHYLFAVLFLDLDDFNAINDSFGHSAGDKLLVQVAKRLDAYLRESDTVARPGSEENTTVARFGGDEFMVFINNLNTINDASRVAERVQNKIAEAFDIDGVQVFMTASIGIAFSLTGYKEPDDLIRDANLAMHRAKSFGKGRYEIFDKELHKRAVARLQLETSLRLALERKELLVFYQPFISLENGQIIGMEALVRWNHPERGLVQPGVFIPVAEENGLILPLGEFVLRTACAQAKEFHNAGFSSLRLAVNFSSHQFQRQNLPDLVGRVLKETEFPAQSFELEITETVAMKDTEFSLKTLESLSSLGVDIVIDDFGTGYSSLGYLKKFHINKVKIDKSFVNDVISNQDSAEIALATIALAHGLHLRVIAEGIETKEQLDFLRKNKCDEMQGYLFSKPIPPDEIAKMLNEGKRLLL